MVNKKITSNGFIPIKKNSKRLLNKNFLNFNKKKLYRHFIEQVNKSDLDDIYVNTDSQEVKNWCKKKNIKFIDRPKYLSKDNANGNDLLLYDSKKIYADIYFQLFVTAPNLKFQTINKSIKILKKNKKYDSLFTAEKIFTWFWFKKKPVNYNPAKLPRSQDAKPMIKETTGLYAIRNGALKKHKCRIGKKPFMLFVDKVEAIDIDDEFDYEVAKKLNEKKKNFNNS